MPTWLKDAVFYEIYPQSFYDSNADGIGDIQGIIEKLPYVKSLGCNAIWLNPCFDSPFKDAGYDVRNYKKVAARYGSNRDLLRCFEEAHKIGIRILLDLVPGHTSDQHAWFRESQRAIHNAYSNRYIWSDSVWNAPQEFRWMTGASERNGAYLLNFFSSQPALNYGFNRITAPWQISYRDPAAKQTRLALLDVMRFWLQRGCDGFRVDMADSLVKNDDQKMATMEIWREMFAEIQLEFPQAAFVSEWSFPERALSCGFHADFYLDHESNGYHALFRKKDLVSGELLSFFSRAGQGDIHIFSDEYMQKYTATKDKGYFCFITGNHDTPRIARDYTTKELMLVYAFIFSMPGVPFLYYGDEIGMRYNENLISKEGGYQRTGSRTPMQWDASANLGFSAASPEKLYLPVDQSPDAPTVAGQTGDPDSLLNHVRNLIQLRHAQADLQADADFEIIYAQPKQYPFVYRRGKYLLGVNPSLREVKLPLRRKGSPVYQIGEFSLDGENLRMSAQSFFMLELS
jgi:maltose alpha-D-glucosyltransferase/alpha-amylase